MPTEPTLSGKAMSDTSAVLASQFEDIDQQRAADTLGMWVFLATEVLFFGGLFVAFFIYRNIYPEAFALAARHLDPLLGGTNTALLITSSLTMTLAERALTSSRQRRWVLALLGVTALLGVAFLGIKGIEYSREFREGLMPLFSQAFHFEGPQANQAELFFHFYFVMTGLHALHLLIGIGVMAVLILQVFGHGRNLAFKLEIAGLYWHFIDVVWLFLFPLLYLATRHG